jgi:DNA-binding ferritin-like protein (Dps family)
MVLDKINDLLKEKKEWQEMQARAKKLPKDYYQAYRSIQKYMFKMGVADWRIFSNIIELFELAVIDGRKPTEVLGEDTATFADELLSDNKQDWREKYRKELNNYFAQK